MNHQISHISTKKKDCNFILNKKERKNTQQKSPQDGLNSLNYHAV